MVDILLYFGSYNPIHLGHTKIAEYLIKKGYAKELWLVVSPQNPFKDKNMLISAKDRVSMAHLATKDIKGVSVCEIELSMPQPSYTIDTLRIINEKYPEKSLGLLIGGDNLPSLSKWKDIDNIVEICSLFVYPRSGYDLTSDFEFTLLKDAPILDVSSTQIRENLLMGQDGSEFLDSRVANYIKAKELW